MSETFAQRVERLKRNNIVFGKLPTEDQRVLASIGRKHCVFSSQIWETLGGNGIFCDSDIYRIRSDYEPEPEWADRVFASTCDMVKDDMNNIVGVTAHCKCGHVFVDDVVHGKHSVAPEPEYVDLPIVKRASDDTSVAWLGVYRHGWPFLPEHFTHLHCLTSLPGFDSFQTVEGGTVHPHWVADRIRKGEKVVARFRKE